MTSPVEVVGQPSTTPIKQQIGSVIDDFLASLPDPNRLSSDQRRDIVARYTAVLEGNFIYWMTGAYLAVGSDEARSIIRENLFEEVRDAHPAMLRRFAMAAQAVPTEADALAVYDDLTKVRMFVGQLAGVPLVVSMAFFEGLIQRFMPFLAELASLCGSPEKEYTDVHGVCDIAHTEGLYYALAAELALCPPKPSTKLFEGVYLLRTLFQAIMDGPGTLARKTKPVAAFIGR